jgi:hypothetical protein
MSSNQQEKLSGYVCLLLLTEKSKDSYGDISHQVNFNPSDLGLKYIYKVMSKVKCTIKDIIRSILQTRQHKWQNAKKYYIQIEKNGQIARMINPKPRSGPMASKIFPPRPGETKRYTMNDHKHKEAALLTHTSWMADPPGTQNCHFLDIINDEVGKCGVHVDPQK